MFLAEAIPAVLLGLVVLRFLPNGPDEAGWLQPEEREWLRGALEQENQIKSEHGEYTTRQALTNGKVWLLAAIYFGVVTSLYGSPLAAPGRRRYFGPWHLRGGALRHDTLPRGRGRVSCS
jgi:hypothetical protein